MFNFDELLNWALQSSWRENFRNCRLRFLNFCSNYIPLFWGLKAIFWCLQSVCTTDRTQSSSAGSVQRDCCYAFRNAFTLQCISEMHWTVSSNAGRAHIQPEQTMGQTVSGALEDASADWWPVQFISHSHTVRRLHNFHRFHPGYQNDEQNVAVSPGFA